MERWTQADIDLAVKLVKEGKAYKEIGFIINKTCKSIQHKLNRKGITSNKFNKRTQKIYCACKNCGTEILDYERRSRKFCSLSCSALYNNPKEKAEDNNKPKKHNICINCGGNNSRRSRKFCSLKCKQKNIFKKIENGDVTLVEQQYKKYLIHKYGNKCMECGWCEVHPITKKVPIQLEHIDGHSTNNSLYNLKLLCPNCHSLTPTYGSLNRGNGRLKRRKKSI